MTLLAKATILLATSALCFCEQYTYVDLSHGYVTFGVPGFPSVTTFRWTEQRQGFIDGFQYRLNDFLTSEHCGTHMDAPYHLDPFTLSVDQIPIERFITTGILINATAETRDNSSYTLPAEKLMEWERENGPFPDPCVVLVDFGWHRFYSDSQKYIGPFGKGIQSPGLSQGAAEYLVETKKVYGVGVDSLSPDEGNNFIVHDVLLGNNIYILENLDLSTPLPTTFHLAVLPMKLVNGTGAPTRVIAWYH